MQKQQQSHITRKGRVGIQTKSLSAHLPCAWCAVDSWYLQIKGIVGRSHCRAFHRPGAASLALPRSYMQTSFCPSLNWGLLGRRNHVHFISPAHCVAEWNDSRSLWDKSTVLMQGWRAFLPKPILQLPTLKCVCSLKSSFMTRGMKREQVGTSAFSNVRLLSRNTHSFCFSWSQLNFKFCFVFS